MIWDPTLSSIPRHSHTNLNVHISPVPSLAVTTIMLFKSSCAKQSAKYGALPSPEGLVDVNFRSYPRMMSKSPGLSILGTLM